MYRTKVHTAHGTSARAELRRATNSAHLQMHGLDPFVQIAAGALPIGDYRTLLQSLFQFHSGVGDAVRGSVWSSVSSAQRRLALLRSDLDFVGGITPLPVTDWWAGPDEALLGALYVAEGSIMGGRVIARQLDPVFGSKPEGRSFFIGDKQDNANWSQLILLLEEECSCHSSIDAAIEGARRTFAFFEKCVRSRSAAEPNAYRFSRSIIFRILNNGTQHAG